MVDFGGWEMPLSYPSGTLAEHRACRGACALFDVSHLGTVRVDGSDAFDRLQLTLSNDLRKVGPGRAQYTHLLDPDDGSVADDIITWWRGIDRFDIMANASNTQRVLDAVGGRDVTEGRAVLAVQGPDARSVLAQVCETAAAVGRFRVAEITWREAELVVAGTGYTGEDGVEISVPVAAAESLWVALVAAGAIPAGLGARDTLRLEAGFPLHGHELGPGITPLQAGLDWVVGWQKDDFRGRAALLREREAGVTRRLRGLRFEGRQPAHAGAPVTGRNMALGAVTSGNFSPTLGQAIALALLDVGTEIGDSVEVEVRDRQLEAMVVALPFVRR